MPKKSKHIRGRPRRPKVDGVTVVRGRYSATINGASTVGSLGVSPLLLDKRLFDLSDAFQEFRFTHLKVTIWSATALTDVVVAYTPAYPTTTPNYSQLTGLAEFRIGNGQFGSPNPTMVVGRSELFANAPKWFRRGTAYDDLLEQQGLIFFGTPLQFDVKPATYLVEYVVELKAMSDMANTAANPLLTGDRGQATPEDELKLVEAAVSMAPPHLLDDIVEVPHPQHESRPGPIQVPARQQQPGARAVVKRT